MNKVKQIFVPGHNGLVGNALLKELQKKNVEIITASRQDLNLLNQEQVNSFFQNKKIDEVYITAAKVGGIQANNLLRADFLYENLVITTNLIKSSFEHKVDRVMFLGSSCMFPKNATQPINEQSILTGNLEPTNEPYAIAKIAGSKLCESFNNQYNTDFRTIVPTNAYGPNDNFDLNKGHVIPNLIEKFHNAKIKNLPYVEVWGSGNALREFLYVNDLAKACVFFMNVEKEKFYEHLQLDNQLINIGTGNLISIKELATLIKSIINYNGEIIFDTTKPDGMPVKCLDNAIAKKMGWSPSTKLKEGLEKTYEFYLNVLMC